MLFGCPFCPTVFDRVGERYYQQEEEEELTTHGWEIMLSLYVITNRKLREGIGIGFDIETFYSRQKGIFSFKAEV